MPVWFEKLAPHTTSRSDSFMSHEATGVPDATQDARPERVVGPTRGPWP